MSRLYAIAAKKATLLQADEKPFFSPQVKDANFFKSSSINIQTKPATTLSWKDKIVKFAASTSTYQQIKTFYKDLLEGEILAVFGTNETVDVLDKGSTGCNPNHVTLMLEAGEGKLADYAPVDEEKEKKDTEQRMKLDKGEKKLM